MLKTVIVDDDDLARKGLKKILKDRERVLEVVGEAGTIEKAIEVIQKNRPDLLLLDIRLKKGTGFDILENIEIGGMSIVFTTAYNEYAIKAIRHSAIDYLLKPIDPKELLNTVDKLVDTKINQSAAQIQVLRDFLKEKSSKVDRIVLSDSRGFHVTKLIDIVRCEGDKNYTSIIMQDGRKIVTTKTLMEYEKMLDPKDFYRIHKSHLVNLEHVRSYKRGRGGFAIMNDGSELPVSREKREGFVSAVKSRAL